MRTILIVLALLLIIAIVAAGVVLVAAGRFGRRAYQRYSGLEQQRASAKQSRAAGVDRLREADRQLVRAQRELVDRGEPQQAQMIEQLRIRLSNATDRHRYAEHGYASLGSPNPMKEAELAELQARDSEAIADSQMINDLSHELSATVRKGEHPDLAGLEAAVDHFIATLDSRSAFTR